jgi:hypothetical protein
MRSKLMRRSTRLKNIAALCQEAPDGVSVRVQIYVTARIHTSKQPFTKREFSMASQTLKSSLGRKCLTTTTLTPTLRGHWFATLKKQLAR